MLSLIIPFDRYVHSVQRAACWGAGGERICSVRFRPANACWDVSTSSETFKRLQMLNCSVIRYMDCDRVSEVELCLFPLIVRPSADQSRS